MKLSAPIYYLKRKARLLSRENKIPLHEALDRVAAEEGFQRWSLLCARAADATTATRLFAQFQPGDIALIGARPGQGKTFIGVQILVEAMKAGLGAAFFTLEYTEKDVRGLFRAVGVDMAGLKSCFNLDTSDAISAEWIMNRLAAAPAGLRGRPRAARPPGPRRPPRPVRLVLLPRVPGAGLDGLPGLLHQPARVGRQERGVQTCRDPRLGRRRLPGPDVGA